MDHQPLLKWPMLLGAAGFLIGFIGPMIFAPSSGNGPMLGIFITGPLGMIAGFALRILSSKRNWPHEYQVYIAKMLCGALAAIVVFAAIAD